MRHAQLARRPGRARVENFDLRARLGQSLGHGIGAVVVGRDDNAFADEDGVTAEIDQRGVGRHHARPVVVGDDERPLDRAGRDDDFFGPDAPERVGQRRPPLPGADEIAVVDAIGRRSRHHPAAGGFNRPHDASRPIPPASALDRPAAMNELTADLGMIVDKENRTPCESGGIGRGESRWSGADDKEIATGIDLRIVGRRTIVGIDPAEAGHGANCALESFPPRPEERLVIEARRQERRQPVEQSGAVGRRRRRRIDRAHGEVVLERLSGRAQIWGGDAAARHVDDRVRLLGPSAPDSARAVIFEAAADDADAVRQQRRSDAVALEADVGLAVKREYAGAPAIDAAARGQTKAAQCAPLAVASAATVALSAVSRVMTNISMQVRCSQTSRATPFGLALNQR